MIGLANGREIKLNSIIFIFELRNVSNFFSILSNNISPISIVLIDKTTQVSNINKILLC